jgi:hypothetical protein
MCVGTGPPRCLASSTGGFDSNSMKQLNEFDWSAIETALDVEGQAVLPGLLSAAECDALRTTTSTSSTQ